MTAQKIIRKEYTGNVRYIRQADIMRCAHVILDPSHYRDDGTCRCDDPSHTDMKVWGYRWKDGRWQA